MIKELIKIANELDSKSLKKEADYLDDIIRKYAFKIKRMTSKCTGFSAIKYRASYMTTDLSDWDKDLYKKTISAFGRDIKKDEISFELIETICSRVHKHIPNAAWQTIPPYVEGTQNRPSVIGFRVEGGKVTYDSSVNGGYRNAHTGFDWGAFDPAPFTVAVQKHINNFNLLGDPRFKFELIIIHGM